MFKYFSCYNKVVVYLSDGKCEIGWVVNIGWTYGPNYRKIGKFDQLSVLDQQSSMINPLTKLTVLFTQNRVQYNSSGSKFQLKQETC